MKKYEVYLYTKESRILNIRANSEKEAREMVEEDYDTGCWAHDINDVEIEVLEKK